MSTVKEVLSGIKVEECAPKSSNILVLSSEDCVPDALKVKRYFFFYIPF